MKRAIKSQPAAGPRGPAKTTRVSVVIPTFNRAAMVKEALESVLAQSCSAGQASVEIIVVDDGSTDDTAAVVATFGARVRYILQSNGGVASARNTGIRRATGDLICFLDSDDVWLPGKLERQLAFLEEHADVGLLATEIEPFNAQDVDLARTRSALYRISNGMVVEELLLGNWIQTSSVMVRRSVLETVGGFDEDVGQFGEDWLLWMRIASAHWIHFLPEALVRYRVHPESLTSLKPDMQFASLMRIYDRVALLPQFQSRLELIGRVRSRVCLARARADLRHGRTRSAVDKLRLACEAKPLAIAATALLWLALVRLAIERKRVHA